MITISTSYALKWRFKNYPHICITSCKKVFNTRTGKFKKKCLNGGSVGYWITARTFIVKSDLNNMVETIPKKEYIPF